MKENQIKKLAVAGILVAVGVVCSPLNIPIGASKCFPIQHMINVLAGVFLGPWYGMGMAFSTSLFRVSMGTGSLLAFPGSMCGAFLCGMVYQRTKNLIYTYVGEVFGTGVIGGLLAWPIAVLVMGKTAALFAYVMPFMVSTVGGTLIAAALIAALSKSGALGVLQKAGR